ncbi:hypothetical protein GVAV_001588 [Gurleya vavrai]
MNILASLFFIFINIVESTFDKIDTEQENLINDIEICKSHDKNESTNPIIKSSSNDKNTININPNPTKNLKKKKFCRLRSYYIKTKIIFYRIKYKYFVLLNKRKNMKIKGFFPFKKNQNIDITKYLEENYFDSKINDANCFYSFYCDFDPVLVEKFNILLFKLFNLRKLYLDLINSTETLQDKKSDSFATENHLYTNFNKKFCNLKHVKDYSSSGSDENYRLGSDSEESNHIKKFSPVKKGKEKYRNEYDEFNNRSFYKLTSEKDKTTKNKLFCNDKFELTYISLYQSMFKFLLTKKNFIASKIDVYSNKNNKYYSNARQRDFKILKKKKNKEIIYGKSLNPFILLKNIFFYSISFFPNHANYIKSWIFANKLKKEKIHKIYNTLKNLNLNFDYNNAYLELDIYRIRFNELHLDVCKDIMLNSGCSKAYINYILRQNKFKNR